MGAGALFLSPRRGPPSAAVTVPLVFSRIVGALDRAGVPYMLTGSFASAYHGTPRATQDIDMIIAPSADQLKALVGQLPEGEYYVDLDDALEALSLQTQLNVVDLATGWTIDLIMRKDRAFSRTEFDRRERIELHGLRLSVATAEDVIIAKLEWAKLGQSQRQIEDAAGILRIQADRLDRAYIARWVRNLDLGREWEDACRLAGLSAQ